MGIDITRHRVIAFTGLHLLFQVVKALNSHSTSFKKSVIHLFQNS